MMPPDTRQVTAASAWFALANYAVVQCVGPNAIDFAQALFANDCASLAVGHWQWSCWLTPQGRVRCVFALFRYRSDHIWLICPGGNSAWLARELSRFILRKKLTIEPLLAWKCIATMQAPHLARESIANDQDEGFIEFDVGTAQLPRSLALVPADHQPVQQNPEQLEAWSANDLRLGLPHLAQNQVDQWTAYQLGLDRLNAFSLHKGCYPGQEIIARTHYLGKNKRSSYLLETPQPVHVGETVLATDQSPIGTIVAAFGPVALAVLPVGWQQWPVQTSQGAAQRQALIDGLAR